MEENDKANPNPEKKEVSQETPKTPETSAITVDIDTLSSEMVGDMPEVSQAAPVQQVEKKPGIPIKGKTDKHGNFFDPGCHAVDKNGDPVINKKDGYLRIIGGRRNEARQKLGGGVKPRLNMPGDAIAQKHNEAQQRASTAAAGIAAASLTFQAGILFGGDEWYPVTDPVTGVNEKKNMENAYIEYFMAKDISDFPPGMALTIALVGYAAPRFIMPKTKARTSKYWGGLKNWWQKRKAKKEAKVQAEEIRRANEKKADTEKARKASPIYPE